MIDAIDIRDITVKYGPVLAISDITASIPSQQITAIVGPNGSGKSTLLKSILGLLPLEQGSVRFWGQHFTQVRDRVAYVPQKEEIDWHYPILVWEAVAMGRYRFENCLRPPSKLDRTIVARAISALGLTGLAHRPIGQLSGGQKQRVFLARALARQADLYLLDEPYNGVDATTERVIKEYIKNLKKEGKTVVFVHHKLDDVFAGSDLTLLINQKLVTFGPTANVFKTDLVQKTYKDTALTLNERLEEQDKCLAYSQS